MGGCSRAAANCPDDLIQIRRRYAATVGAFRLTVETEGGISAAEVRENGALLYSARRGSVAAAQAVALEFAAFQTRPEIVSNAGRWTESWV